MISAVQVKLWPKPYEVYKLSKVMQNAEPWYQKLFHLTNQNKAI